MERELYKEARSQAEDFYRKDIESLTSRIYSILEKQRRTIGAMAESLWDDARKSEDYNSAVLHVAALIRDGEQKSTAQYPGLSLMEEGRVSVVAKKN
jgi:hypothetical protein